ncbi:MAG: RsmB/NOP family class I SAM-dependent RNA methyltransferase [Planctomycetota bacterium]
MSDRVPDAFLEHLAPRIPDADEREALRRALERPLPTTFRVQSGDEAAILAGLAARGLESVPLPFARGGHRVVAGPDPGPLLEHAIGRLYVQEAASMIAGETLLRTAPAAPDLVLDLCASPGSKTTQLAAGLPAATTLLANEPTPTRVKVLAANLLRTGSAAALSQADGRALGPRLAGRCDAVLVDAPCSGEGTVRRDPKALRGWHRRRFPRFTSVQSELLRAAAIATRPGGVVVYSTCALSPEENHEVVAAAVASGDFETIPLGPAFPNSRRA